MMQIGTILITLALSMALAAYILRPFQTETDDIETAIEERVAGLRQAALGKSEAQFCTQCGHRLGPDDRFCAQCGHPVGEAK